MRALGTGMRGAGRWRAGELPAEPARQPRRVQAAQERTPGLIAVERRLADGVIIPSPTIADEMQEWLETQASDGFTVMFPYLPGGLDDFVERVVPELQRRDLFRRDYEGATLREHLGLPRPNNRFFQN